MNFDMNIQINIDTYIRMISHIKKSLINIQMKIYLNI